MLNCLFCQPLNTIVRSVQDIAAKYSAKRENRKKHCNKNHKETDDNINDKIDYSDYNYEDIISDNEFMKRYKLLNDENFNEKYLYENNGKNNNYSFGCKKKVTSVTDNNQIKSINKVISSIKCLTDCMKLYGSSKSDERDHHRFSINNINEWIIDKDRKYLKTWNRQRLNKKSRDTYNNLFMEYACLPKKHAPSVLYKICCILDQILPYVGYITFNTWKTNTFNRKKLIKLHTIHLYLLFARKELLTATEYYTANKEPQLVKRKINSLWWALNAAKKQLYQVKRKSQLHLKYSTHTCKRSCLFKKLSMFNLLKNCCLDGNFLKYKKNPLRRCITDDNIPKISYKVLKAFRIDKKTLIRRPQSK